MRGHDTPWRRAKPAPQFTDISTCAAAFQMWSEREVGHEVESMCNAINDSITTIRVGVLDDKLMASVADEPNTAVVTVPASFHVAQQHETVAAAEHAGFGVVRTRLPDEPLAAFVDILAMQPLRLSTAPGSRCDLLSGTAGLHEQLGLLSAQQCCPKDNILYLRLLFCP